MRWDVKAFVPKLATPFPLPCDRLFFSSYFFPWLFLSFFLSSLPLPLITFMVSAHYMFLRSVVRWLPLFFD